MTRRRVGTASVGLVLLLGAVGCGSTRPTAAPTTTAASTTTTTTPAPTTTTLAPLTGPAPCHALGTDAQQLALVFDPTDPLTAGSAQQLTPIAMSYAQIQGTGPVTIRPALADGVLSLENMARDLTIEGANQATGDQAKAQQAMAIINSLETKVKADAQVVHQWTAAHCKTG